MFVLGRGIKIEANLLSTQVACNSHIAANWLNTGIEAKRYGTGTADGHWPSDVRLTFLRLGDKVMFILMSHYKLVQFTPSSHFVVPGHGSIVPYQAFPTSDGHFLIVGAGNDAHFAVLCQLLDMPPLASDPRFHTNGDRVINRSALIPLLIERFQSEPLDHWMETFRGCALPYGPVNTMKQVFEDPQVDHNRMVWQFDHPVAGKVRVPGHPVKYLQSVGSVAPSENTDGSYTENDTEGSVDPAPLLGQHTDWVLKNIAGCSSDEVAILRDKNIAY